MRIDVVKLEQYQAAVLTFLFDRLPIGNDADTLEFSLSGEFSGKYRVAHSCIESSGPAMRLVFTLPTYACSVFIALTRTRLNEAARILANLEDYERGSSMQLGLGEVVVTPDQELEGARMPHAVILLRTAASLDCAGVPDRHTIDGRETSFYLVVPLTKDEWELRRRRGHDALIDKFPDEAKELLI
ncbi:suppressor of fused domain protein [Burkholderia stagnalis]|uniref:suppressor of fused domain protein n=1 Tax=Burkholderia stagnalis TaxID=1503054 RepID=UPI0009BE1183|nr:suppressor of fused domain protein [Burkholderia stagnalis]